MKKSFRKHYQVNQKLVSEVFSISLRLAEIEGRPNTNIKELDIHDPSLVPLGAGISSHGTHRSLHNLNKNRLQSTGLRILK